tara:strand:- start:272 stop:1306 length:1035 start_codon:yes stop_codon:yes gene_type:complete
MGVPSLKFSKATVPSTSNFYSTASNFNSTIRVQADFSSGVTTVTNVQDQAGWNGFGKSSIRTGMFLMSSGETNAFTRITDWNPGTSTITLESPAIGGGTGETNVRIACPKGMYILESASISKQGTGEPNDMRDITGSSDADYNEGDQKWGIIAQLSKTSNPGTAVQGEYSQYTILSVENREGTNQANLIITASDEFPPFSEPDDHLAVVNTQFMVSSFVSESLMTLASAADLNMSQGFGVAAWNNSVASHLVNLTSGSGDTFPYTGSAEITGSLSVTGSSIVSLDTNENFLINNTTAVTQSLFKIDSEGIAIFRVQPDGATPPTPEVGHVYFTTESVFFGFEGT